ncbi:MAG: hypothetical protein UZ15_CFX003000233 [Chloroflexi bacterium OLB15]|nr:MAG: hypothetical protein UZ15_CFX003000233 [Chloroflexi bacterium OLB15]
MSRLIGLLATALAISSGLIMLIGLATGALSSLTNLLLQITIITAGMAIIIGVVNLLSVHLRRIVGRERGLLYSLALVLSFLLVIVLYALGADAERRILLRDVEGSIESALAALLVFALVYGAYRLMRRGVTWAALLFTLALLITLLGALPFSQLGVFGRNSRMDGGGSGKRRGARPVDRHCAGGDCRRYACADRAGTDVP